MNETRHPRLDDLIAKGTIWFDEYEQDYAGIATDGIVVSLGNDKASVENYLSHCPTPDKW